MLFRLHLTNTLNSLPCLAVPYITCGAFKLTNNTDVILSIYIMFCLPHLLFRI